MATYQITAPDGSKYRLTGPDNASHDDLVNAVLAQHPMAGMTTEELENAPRASTSIGDIGRSFGMGVTGAAKSLTDVFGAGSGVSNYLGDVTTNIGKGLTPERKDEMARREELVKRAQGKGLGSELYANLAGVMEAPLQSIAQAAGSSIPSILAGLAALPEAAPAGIVLGVEVAARALMGAAQGVGETKGDIHDQIKQAYLEKGASEADAEKKAIEAQSYTIKTAPTLIGGAAFGALDAATGLQSSASRALREAIHPVSKELSKEGLETAFKQLGKEPLTAPSGVGTFFKQAAEEGIPEGLQGGYGQLAQNVAMQQQGFETPTFEGVAGASSRDALVGALTGGAFSPMAHSQAQQDFEADRELRRLKSIQEEDAKRQARVDEINANPLFKQQADLKKEQVGALLLPAPAKTAEKIDEAERLNNPLGNLTKDELHPEVTKYIDKYRKDNGMPKLDSYSIEDVKDAMTSENPNGEQGALDAFITAKTGYEGKEKYTPDDVINAAVKNNVAPDTQGFKDFLSRTTGVNDLNAMSQPQLYSAFKALMDLNRTEYDDHLILPEGTNASRYTQKQYDSALKFVKSDLTEPKPINDVLEDIKGRTGLDNDRDAQALLNKAIKDEDLTKTSRKVFNVTKDGEVVSTHDSKREAQVSIGKKKGYEIQPETVTEIGPKAAEVKPEEVRTPLPQGYEIQKEALQEKEEPKGHAIIPEGQQKALTTVPTLEGIKDKIDIMQGARREEAARLLADLEKHKNTVASQQNKLTRMEALGNANTEKYKKLSAQHENAKEILNKRIKHTYDQVERLETPLKTQPFGKKITAREVHTVIKDGKKLGSFPSNDAAMKSIVSQLSDKELNDLAKDDRKGAIKSHAKEEIDLREAKAQGKKTSPEVKERIIGKKPEPKKEPEKDVNQQLREDVEKSLKKELNKFGLKDVEVKLAKAIDGGAEGSYLKNLIQVAYDAENPFKTMRHEAIHALKELGFFTDSQWKALNKQAKETWVDKYLKDTHTEIDGEIMSRYDGYKLIYEKEHGNLNGFENYVNEEAIADAFAEFEANKNPPPGMISALFKRLQQFFNAIRAAFTGAGYETAEEIFGKIESGELESVRPNTWKADKEEIKKATEYKEKHGIDPYTSEGQIDIPLESEDGKFSLKKAYTEKNFAREERKKAGGEKYKVLKNDPITGLPMNQDGTVTLYYPTTNEGAKALARSKKLTPHSDTANKIWLTNESSAPAITEKPGMIDQPVGGANVLLKVDPSMIHLGEKHEDGRMDFFIPIAEGEAFAKKMAMTKMFTLNAPRNKGLHPDRTLNQVSEAITDTAERWENASPKERREMARDAKITLISQHNISQLFGANSKLEKTNIGEHGLTYKGKMVMSTGLGFASAQKINDEQIASTCAKSAICEALCLGETSGQNLLYGGEGQFRSGPRLAQYLKTEALVVNPEAFTISLIRQISAFERAANQLGFQPAIRLNVTSDFKPSTFESVIKMFPNVMFYDYTKLETQPIAPNHHLTYSSTGASQIVDGKIVYNKESNWDRMVNKFLMNGKNVAMAFTSRDDMPKFIIDEKTGQRFEVWNGDEYDARFLDPAPKDGKGYIIGLTNKDNTTKPEDATEKHNGFFLDYDKKRDGDELKILDQNKLKPGKPVEFVKKQEEKLSLKTYYPTAEEAENAAHEKAPPETHEFKLFFGASHVKEEGRPQVMYHGTDQEINQFRENVPIFVSPDAKFAEQFASRRVVLGGGGEKKVYPLWVRSETPFDYQNPEHVQQALSALNHVSMSDYLKIEKELPKGLWTVIEDARFQGVIQKLGFDSFYVSEQGTKNLAVFSATQVKSVTGNIGEFGANKDIRYSLPTSDAFKRFFKNSKVVDENGNPLIVYHSSKVKNVNEFNKKYKTDLSSFGFHFGTKEQASFRTTQYDFNSNTPSMGEYYLSINNPLEVSHMGSFSPDHLADKMMDMDILDPEKYEAMSKKHDYDSLKLGNELVKILKKYGYDGLVYENEREGEGKSYVPFDPTQIKSATENIGTYDVSNPDVRYSLPPLSKDIEDRINETTTRREEKGYAQRITEAISPKQTSYWRQKALNRYNQLSVYDKMLADKMGGVAFLADQSAEAAALMSDLSAGVAASSFGVGDRHGGVPVFRKGVTTIDTSVKGLVAALAPLAKTGDPAIYQRFQYWAGSKRGFRLDQEGREHNFTAADYVYAKELGQLHPEFEQVMKDYTAYNEGIVKYQIDTGVLSKEEGENFLKYADYIPFYREVNENTLGPNVNQAISNVKKPKKLKGGEAPLADFLETVVRNAQSAINAGMKNQAAQRSIKVALDLDMAEKVKPGEKTTGAEIISVLENGKVQHYRTGDTLFVDAIKSLNMPELPFMSLISAPSNLLRNFVTKDPGFMLANMMRDSLSAWVTSGKDIKPFIGTIGQFTKALKGNSPEFEALMNAGILGGYEFSQNVKQSGINLEKDLTKKNVKAKGLLGKTLATADWVWEGLEKGTTASDAATRSLVYERVYKETGNEAEALYRALEVMNFNRKGNSPVVRILTAAVPFLNARFQGLDVFWRTASGGLNDPNAKQMQRAFIKRGLLLMGLTAMYYACVQGDPDYEKQEEETKDNYWILPSAGVKIPIPFEVGVLFKVLPERLISYMMGNNTGKDLMDSAVRNMANTFAFNPIPQAVKPIVEDVTNFNFFTMRPIVGQGMEGLEAKYQTGPNTSITAQKLGAYLDHSPLKIDNMIRGYFGAVGTYATDLLDTVLSGEADAPKADKRLEQMAFFKRFMVDKEARGNITAFYALKHQVDMAVKTQNYLKEAGNPDEFQKYVIENQAILANKDYVNTLDQSMKQYRDMRKMINGLQMSGPEKLELNTEIGRAENNLTENIKELKKIIASQ